MDRTGDRWVDRRGGRTGGRLEVQMEDRSEAQTEDLREDRKGGRKGGRKGDHWEVQKAVYLAVLKVARQAVGWAGRASAGSTAGQRRVRIRSPAA